MDVPEFLRNGQVLIVTFAVLAIGSAIVTILAVGGGTTELAYGLGGGLLAGGIIVGTYLLATRSGLPHSHAVAAASVIFGVVLLVGVLAELLVDSGRLSNLEIALFVGGGLVAILALFGVIRVLDRTIAPS